MIHKDSNPNPKSSCSLRFCKHVKMTLHGFDWVFETMVHCRSDLGGPRMLQEVWLTNCGLVPLRVLVCQRDEVTKPIQRSVGHGSNGTDLFHSFIVSLGAWKATWRCSQGCDCVAIGSRWKINLWPWILRQICGYILGWDFWLCSAGCSDWDVSPNVLPL